ncbi:MAG: hypothetical protein K6T59_14665 [Bryobacteraceae bacterium]|nr:hypothetical protein [Bryobacteraceae bacterium]
MRIGVVRVAARPSGHLRQASTRCVGVVWLIADGTPFSKMVEREFGKSSQRLRPLTSLDLLTTNGCRGLLCR